MNVREQLCFGKLVDALGAEGLEIVLDGTSECAANLTDAEWHAAAGCWAAVGDYLAGYISEAELLATFDDLDPVSRLMLYAQAGERALRAKTTAPQLFFANVAVACWQNGRESPLDLDITGLPNQHARVAAQQILAHVRSLNGSRHEERSSDE